MKTLLIAICFAFAVPTFASTSNTPQKTVIKKFVPTEIGDNDPPQDKEKPKG
jgi:hypothetical protein